MKVFFIFYFQAEDGIRDPLWSRGLGEVYKRQVYKKPGGGTCSLRSAGILQTAQNLVNGMPIHGRCNDSIIGH